MNNILLSGITTPPKGSRSLASQLGFFFTIILVILIVISNTITSAYTAVLEQDRSDALESMASANALSVACTDLQRGMSLPVPVGTYIVADQKKDYIVNIYTKAGNSFLRVYTSLPSDDTDEEQVTLEGAGEEYRKAFDLEKIFVVPRSDDSGRFVAAVAPIKGTEGTVSGLMEVMMPASDFYSTTNGISLSWVFTMISIAVALSMVYYEISRLLTTMFGQPDRQLPKIIRYGMPGCQSVAFFSSMACTMPPLVISSHILAEANAAKGEPIPPMLLILAGGFLFVWGFIGFSSLRASFVRRLTTRISLILFIFAAFVMLAISSVFDNIYIYLIFLLPIGFSLGMVFYFQREYRIYASRLGYEDFSENRIMETQYTGYILGACVGAVMAGIVYERFGLMAVSVICGCILLIVGIQALLFVQHCPPSSNPALHLPNFLYALSSKRSGAFLWSGIVSAGVQTSFFFLFVPEFLKTHGLSMATVSFYYITFFFISSVAMKVFIRLFPSLFSMQKRIIMASVLQIAGILLLAFFPTSKMLVATVVFLGSALGLHEFHYLDYYREMIREDKKVFARLIVERAFAMGAIIGAAAFGAVFLAGSLRISLLIYTVFLAVLLFDYPLHILLYNQHDGTPTSGGENARGADQSETLSENYREPPYGIQPIFGQKYGQAPYSQSFPASDPYRPASYGEDTYEQDPYMQEPYMREPFGHEPYGTGSGQDFDGRDPYDLDPYGSYGIYNDGQYGKYVHRGTEEEPHGPYDENAWKGGDRR